MGFEIDDKNKNCNKGFRNLLSIFSSYKTPGEEEIDYLAEHYIKKYIKELEDDNHQCLEYLNLLRIYYNNAIEGLNKISQEYTK